MSQVWANSKHKGSTLVLLLAIADFADDEGYAYPAVQTLSHKCRMSERNTRYTLRALVDSGELLIKRGAGQRGANLYRVTVERNLPLFDQQSTGAKIAPAKIAPATGGIEGVQPASEGAAIAIAPEPSVNISKPSGARATRLSPDWQLPKALGDWALKDQPTWTADHVRRVAENFRDHWIAVPGQRGTKLDWPATWRKWVRSEGAMKATKNGARAKPWFLGASGITEKGRARGFDVPADARGWDAFKAKVYEAEGVTPEMIRTAQVDHA
jgi:hypothetical protein